MADEEKRTILGERRIGTGTILFGLFGGALAWSLHLLVSYFLVALFCTTGWRGADAALVVATVVLAGAVAASGWVAYRNWRRASGDQPWDLAIARPPGWAPFLMLLAVPLNGLFLVITVLAGLPPLFVPTCP